MLKYDKNNLKQLLYKGFKFLHSSLAAFITNMVVLTFSVEILRFPETLGYLLSIFCATSVSFLVCRYFVFTEAIRPKFFKQYAQFLSSSAMFRAVEFCLFWIFVEFYNFYYLYVFLVIQSCATIFKFFFFKKFIFDKNSKTAK